MKFYYTKTLLITFLLFLQCTSKNNIDFSEIKAKGEYEQGSYIFCSIYGIERHYSYRVGIWQYYNKNIKIAEGKYEIVKNTEDTIGGCPFEYYESNLNLKYWQFWNEKGELIKPTSDHIYLIDPKREYESVRLQNQIPKN